jgi:glutamate racemase
MRKLLPSERFVFYGDNANAPYGIRQEDEIIALTCAAVDELLARNIKALVLACNTATSAAAPTLRARLSIPVVGMEPALKPAQAMRHGGRILVMATPATLRLPKFDALMRRYGEGAVPAPIRGLVELIQAGETCGEAVENCLHENLAPYLDGSVDAAVLGCTHYLFAKRAIAKVLGPTVELVDGNLGTARQLKRLLEEGGMLREGGEGGMQMLTSGNMEHYLPVMERMLHWSMEETPEIR